MGFQDRLFAEIIRSAVSLPLDPSCAQLRLGLAGAIHRCLAHLSALAKPFVILKHNQASGLLKCRYVLGNWLKPEKIRSRQMTGCELTYLPS